jgi:hypothetical protein
MYVKQQNERQKILLSGQFQSPKAQHHRKTKNTTVETGSKIQKSKIIERQKILLLGQVPKSKRTKS